MINSPRMQRIAAQERAAARRADLKIIALTPAIIAVLWLVGFLYAV